jgi:hypothetical protein
MLNIQNLYVSIGGKPIIDGLSLTLPSSLSLQDRGIVGFASSLTKPRRM